MECLLILLCFLRILHEIDEYSCLKCFIVMNKRLYPYAATPDSFFTISDEKLIKLFHPYNDLQLFQMKNAPGYLFLIQYFHTITCTG